MMFLKKTVPFLLTIGMGVFTFAYYFIPHEIMQNIWDVASEWAVITGTGALVVGIVSMVRTYFKRAMNRTDPNRWYNVVALVSFAVMTIIGFVTGVETDTLFNKIFMSVMVPLDSTMFSLLSFYIASAAFRSFRLKNFSAGLLLCAAILIMLAQIPLGALIWEQIPYIKDWVLDYPNVAAQRAIMIGIAIGSASTALKIILGIDKSVFAGAGKK